LKKESYLPKGGGLIEVEGSLFLFGPSTKSVVDCAEGGKFIERTTDGRKTDLHSLRKRRGRIVGDLLEYF